MSFSVYQHWDPLKVCIVGRSYSPNFYSFISNDKVRIVMERIARETEEDYQKLISLLESFGVTVLRPNVSDDYTKYLQNNKIIPPPMTPRDYSIMLGNDFYFKSVDLTGQVLKQLSTHWNVWRGSDWPGQAPTNIDEVRNLPDFIKKELDNFWPGEPLSNLLNGRILHEYSDLDLFTWQPIFDYLKNNNQKIIKYVDVPALDGFNSAMTTRVGKDIYIGTDYDRIGMTFSDYRNDQDTENNNIKIRQLTKKYPEYRWHVIDTGGHADGTFCPVTPGLIVSLRDIPTYADTFPGWEVIYLQGQSWTKVKSFLDLKEKNKGKWWVPGEELNNEFTEFVEEWLSHWVGYVEETVFDVNMLVIDKQNVVCNNYNEAVFDAFSRYGITTHIVNFRHRYFWDGGLHCITSDVHREGSMENYFPARGR